MCVAEAGLVVTVTDVTAQVSIRGRIRDVPLTVVAASGPPVSPGDWVLVHTGLAVAILSPQEAAEHSSFLVQGAAHEDT